MTGDDINQRMILLRALEARCDEYATRSDRLTAVQVAVGAVAVAAAWIGAATDWQWSLTTAWVAVAAWVAVVARCVWVFVAWRRVLSLIDWEVDAAWEELARPVVAEAVAAKRRRMQGMDW